MSPVFYPFRKGKEPHWFHKEIANFLGCKETKSKKEILTSENILSECLDLLPTMANIVDRKNLVSIVGDPVLWRRKEGNMGFLGKIFSSVALSKVDLFISVGDLNRRYLEKEEKDVITVYPFLKKDFTHVEPNLESKNILTIVKEGEDELNYWKKGLDRYEKLARRLPSYDFKVIGTDLETDIENLSYEGWVESIEPYLEKSSIAVFPSRFDSFNIAALECMSAGIPTFTSNMTGISLFNESGFCFDHINEAYIKILTYENLSKKEKQEKSHETRKRSYVFTKESFHSHLSDRWKKLGLWKR